MLIDNWRRTWWRLWSVRLAAAGTALTSLLTLWPDSALYLWQMMPDEVRGLVPERAMTMLGVVIFAASIVARLVKQKALHDDPEE
ncbi:hypothetical protein [Zavarzinia aquatilis]|uniref:Holin n=1 Tax=Zavarzinia aquatilis TaxID=2211142 RepID=A0A317EEQ1_9PROT|nr:hypothetical protein [Zavarzinia aquatilis]PWR24590.1 hypothetical protein DKG74_07230 [Zavarzinia aquatilis]